jgi:hypothetical protein
MSLGKEYEEGTVVFDPLMVVGKDFVSGSGIDTHYFDYAYTVTPVMSQKKRKKGDPEHFRYDWNGYLNIGLKYRIHLHNIEPDVGLVEQEAKLQLLKDTLDEFLKEFRARLKTPGKKDLVVKNWLNPETSRYTSFAAYNLDKNGNGSFSISDCHKSNVIWVYTVRDDSGKVRGGHYSTKEIQTLEEVSKGVGKSIRAIQQLRKFFEREVLDSPSEK